MWWPVFKGLGWGGIFVFEYLKNLTILQDRLDKKKKKLSSTTKSPPPPPPAGNFDQQTATVSMFIAFKFTFSRMS